MSFPVASRATIEALVRTQRKRAETDGEAAPRVIGVQAQPEWAEATSFDVDGDPVRVAPCRSALEVRLELAERDDPAEWLVLLTDREQRELGLDVLAKLVRRRLQSIDVWSAVAEAFDARTVDSALRRMPELARALLAHRPSSGYPPVSGTALDRDTAWTAFAERVLGVHEFGRDPEAAVLEWLASGDAAVGLAAVGAEAADGWWEWLTERVGAVAGVWRALSAAGRAEDAIAVGLCARLVASAEDVDTARVQGRLEQVVGTKLDAAVLARYADAAERATQPRDLARAEKVVEELHADSIAGRSDLLRSGFDQRLAVAATALRAAIEDPSCVAEAESALEACRAHHEHSVQTPRLEALAMAVRLVRRLALGPSPDPASFADAASWFAADSASVDRARSRMWRGESQPDLVKAYQELDARLFALRESENHRFATLLNDWLQSGSPDPRIVPVEQVLDKVIAPLASTDPVLLIVMDGLSWSTWLELSSDFPGLGWDEVLREDLGARLIGVATVPSVTTYSRTSLLTGELASGTAKEEAKGFAAAFADKVASATLFHKADLVPGGGGTVAAEVLTAIADPKRRVIGVVINEIDDALAGGLQADRRFRVAEIGPLMTCLEAARNAGRICIVTSDHGHVVEYEVDYRTSGGRAERWRPASDDAGDGEIALSGQRVLTADGALVAPWTERVRYSTGKSAGYHGGATPQEMLVPIAVFAPRGQSVEAWRSAAPAIPAWWEEAPPVPGARTALPVPAQGLLDPRLAEPPWLDDLLGSAAYATQRDRNARVAVDDDRARRVLAFLASRGDRGTIGALAQALDLPEHRARGVITGLRRVLALDGFDVLSVVEDDVTLDRALLLQQFGLDGAGA